VYILISGIRFFFTILKDPFYDLAHFSNLDLVQNLKNDPNDRERAL